MQKSGVPGDERYFWADMVCRGCGKCVRACPAGIDIPSLLVMEEVIHAGGNARAAKADCLKRRERRNVRAGQPIDCIECGICDMRCPQGFHLLEIVRRYAMRQSSLYAGADTFAMDET